MTTRGGQGTAEKIISSTNPIFYEPHLWVPKDIHPEIASNLINLFREMEKERHKNTSLEKTKADKKDSPPSKKRISAADVMSEQEMFQEELLKVVERIGRVEARQNKIIRVLNGLQQRFQEHISLDLPGATDVTPTISLTGSQDSSSPMKEICTDKTCLACNKVVRDCKCFED